MSDLHRRQFLLGGSTGVVGLGLGALSLAAGAQATAASGNPDDYADLLAQIDARAVEIEPARPAANLKPTEDNILGPYHRTGAPFRAKITPPMEPGTALVVRGRVWALNTRKPLPHAIVDIWQANAEGRYDNDDPKKPPKKGIYVNRARIVADENGYYEYETIKPGRYQIGQDQWRPAHIHYMVQSRGYKSLITQLYFKGDPENKRDRFIKPSLIIDPATVRSERGNFLLGTFDIVLPKAG